jgi:predicted metal-binding membrane protein
MSRACGGVVTMNTRRAEAVRRGRSISAFTGAREEAAERAFLGVAASVFAASTAITIFECTSMSAMGGLTMPGGRMMSMAWMRMPGQSWAGAFGSFLLMWLAMMVAMMLPSLLPALQRCRARLARPSLSIVVALGYFVVSIAAGAVVFPVGVALAAVQMQWPFLAHAAPCAAGLVVVVAGLVQFTRWKAHHLACCREASGHGGAGATGTLSAWRSGLRLGLHCTCCCAPQMAVLLVTGIMDLRAMALVTAVITAERLLAAGPRIARGAGAVAVAGGLLVVAHAAGLA